MSSRGLTLIEVIVAMGILALLAALATVSWRPFGRRVDLQTARQQVLATLRLARDQTLDSAAASTYGVHFESDRYILFKGETYNPTDSSNQVHILPARLEFYDIVIGGGQSVVFNRLEGTTNNPGTISLHLINQPTESATISILASGQASSAQTVTTANSRLTDTRHVHLNLTWSIQNSTTLTLDFGATEEVINMAPYFNAAKTAFAWQGTVNVDGQDQTLELLTHQLDANTTLLSIRRDRRYATKAVEIFINGQKLISYAANGAATVGPFGGTLTIQ